MLNYTQLKKEIEEKGTEEIKYKLYNSDINNKDLYEMYKDTYDFVLKEEKTDKKRAKICSAIIDTIYKHNLYYKVNDHKKRLNKIHEDILKRDTYLKAKGFDRFETLTKREDKI